MKVYKKIEYILQCDICRTILSFTIGEALENDNQLECPECHNFLMVGEDIPSVYLTIEEYEEKEKRR